MHRNASYLKTGYKTEPHIWLRLKTIKKPLPHPSPDKITSTTTVKTAILLTIQKKKSSPPLATKYAGENDIYTHPNHPSILTNTN